MKKTRVRTGMSQLHLRFLPRFLFDTEAPKAPYILKAWLLTFLPSLLLAQIVTSQVANPATPQFDAEGPYLLFLLAIVAPIAETLIMVPPLLLLNRLFGPGPAIVANAALWGIAHSLATPIWGLVVWWPFLIFSAIFLAWRERSVWIAIAMVATVHGIQNAIAAMGLWIGTSA